MITNLLGQIFDNYWKFVEHSRKVRFTVHRAFFLSADVECYFLNVTNLSAKKEIEITHVFFEDDDKKQTPVIQKDRPLPKRLAPDETWETWIRVDLVSKKIINKPYRKAYIRLSTGKIIQSRYNRNIPQTGEVPGGIVTQI